MLSGTATDLLDRLLAVNPTLRPTAADASASLLSAWKATDGPAEPSWQARSNHGGIGANVSVRAHDIDVETVPVYRSGAGARHPLKELPPELVMQPRFYDPNQGGGRALREAGQLLRAASKKAQDAVDDACKIS